VFCETERKQRESFAFRHWQQTGLIPKLIWDADESMIVMSYVPGVHLYRARQEEGETAWREACRQTGRAVAALTKVRLSATDRVDFESRFYGGLGRLEAYLGRILDLGRSIQAQDPGFQDVFWQDNLDSMDAELDAILSQPRLLYHQDVGNLHIQQGRFVGFYDLEMCRVGCAAMQLAASLGMLKGSKTAWHLFRKGWEEVTEQFLGADDLRAVAAAKHLLCWREISRYLSYDGRPGTGYA
jgi:hypothetical protein